MSTTSPTHSRRGPRYWKERWVAENYAKVKSPQILAGFIEHKGFTYTEFARRVKLERTQTSERGISRQMLMYLATGRMHSCRPDLAECIERVLDAPPGTIFDVLPKSRDKRESDKQSASAA